MPGQAPAPHSFLAPPVVTESNGRLAAPAENAAINVGSDTDEFLFDQFSGDYNATLKGTSPIQLYSCLLTGTYQ